MKSRTSPSLPADSTPLLRERVTVLFRHVPGGIGGVEEDLHEMRVAARRLRVALPLLARKPASKRVRRARRLLRAIVRSGGRGRDFDVMLGLLDARGAERAPGPQERRLRRSLRGSHAWSRTTTAEALMDVDIARLRSDLRKACSRGGDGLFRVLARIRRARDAEGEALRSGVNALGARFDPEALHALRRGVRRLRYTAEVQADLQGRRLEAPRLLKRLQGLLGEINDAVVFSRWAENRSALAEQRGDLPLAAEAAEQWEWALARARGLHQSYLEADPSGILERALRSMGSSSPAGGAGADTPAALERRPG